MPMPASSSLTFCTSALGSALMSTSMVPDVHGTLAPCRAGLLASGRTYTIREAALRSPQPPAGGGGAPKNKRMPTCRC